MFHRHLPIAFIASLLAVFVAGGPAPVMADEMNVFIKNLHPRAVVIELFSRTRDHRWPGDDKVYLLERAEQKSVVIDCEQGEQICYGAWVNGNDGTYWGVGPDNNKACDDCCHICVKSSTAEALIGK